jgi:hypothetical protein
MRCEYHGGGGFAKSFGLESSLSSRVDTSAVDGKSTHGSGTAARAAAHPLVTMTGAT